MQIREINNKKTKKNSSMQIKEENNNKTKGK